jgi:hypothetical protein
MEALQKAHLISFLENCSLASLGDFQLSRLNRASHLERELSDLTHQLLENLAFAELANILRGYGESIVSATGPGLIAVPRNPWHWVGEGWTSRLTPRQRHVCLGVIRFQDVTGWASISISNLVLWTGLSKSTVKRALRVLKATKIPDTETPLLEIDFRKGKRGQFRVNPDPNLVVSQPVLVPGSHRPRLTVTPHQGHSDPGPGSHRPTLSDIRISEGANGSAVLADTKSAADTVRPSFALPKSNSGRKPDPGLGPRGRPKKEAVERARLRLEEERKRFEANHRLLES